MSFGERFLHNPDLFPARRAGEVWGDREVILDLPGGPYRLAGLAAAQEESLRSGYGDLCRPRGAAPPPADRAAAVAPGTVTEARIFRAAAADFRQFDTRGWDYELDTDNTPEAVRLAGLRLLARLEWRPTLAAALWTSEGEGELFPGICENFLRILVAYRLLEAGGVVLHSAGLLLAGSAFLFLGRSGAGKTTLARLASERGAEVLSDDLNAVCPANPAGPANPANPPNPPNPASPPILPEARPAAALALVHKLPFTGDLGDRAVQRPPAALRAFFRLEKAAGDADDAIAPLSRAEAVACMLACAPFVNADPHRRERLLSNLLDLLPAGRDAAGAYSLRFSLAGGFWSILNERWQISTARAC
ncbi:MAG TPA: hypothetical protein VHR45_06600 [Thermoanaerobaculia bacterium]|nr:hypothetical protein [Thermoanaerobaculia bacterium]